MLEALHRGVQGGKWHNLIDKVYAERNLARAHERVAGNRGARGVDGVTVARYGEDLEHNQRLLGERLRSGSYEPLPVRRVHIPKPGGAGTRPLGIPCVRDRIAQCALKQVIEPIFEARFHPSSHGFRPGRGCKDALRETESLLESGRTVVVDADIRGFFDNIDQSRLLARVRERIADGRVLDLVEAFLRQGVMEGTARWTPETGVPQGAVVSPLLANILLDGLDWTLAGQGVRFVRYADDFVLLCRDREEAERALALAADWLGANGLELHPEKTRVVDMSAPDAQFEFLGYRFKRHVGRDGRGRILRLVARKSRRRLADRLRELLPRTCGVGLATLVGRLNPVLRGWYGYFRQCYRTALAEVDRMVRRRLRRILRKWNGKPRGSGRCADDHDRWPNAFFRELGLLSLVDAQASELQSLRGTR